MRRVVLIGLALAVAASEYVQPAMHSSAQAAIRLENAWARRAPAMAHGQSGGHGATAAGGTGNGAMYVTIVNDGSSADALVGATTDAAKTVELHETTQEGGVMKMRPLPRFDVPGGGRLEMKPGGHHIMLLGLTRDLKPGDTVRVTLTFETGGRMSIEAPVR
jgi:copper(I)-binding protein